MSEHRPGPDWTCACGYDYFGGSAGYSWQLFLAHLPEAPEIGSVPDSGRA